MHNEANNPIKFTNVIILRNANMTFKKYLIECVMLPYYTAAKKFCRVNSFAYKLFIFLNLIWVAGLITLFLMTIVLSLV